MAYESLQLVRRVGLRVAASRLLRFDVVVDEGRIQLGGRVIFEINTCGSAWWISPR